MSCTSMRENKLSLKSMHGVDRFLKINIYCYGRTTCMMCSVYFVFNKAENALG